MIAKMFLTAFAAILAASCAVQAAPARAGKAIQEHFLDAAMRRAYYNYLKEREDALQHSKNVGGRVAPDVDEDEEEDDGEGGDLRSRRNAQYYTPEAILAHSKMEMEMARMAAKLANQDLLYYMQHSKQFSENEGQEQEEEEDDKEGSRQRRSAQFFSHPDEIDQHEVAMAQAAAMHAHVMQSFRNNAQRAFPQRQQVQQQQPQRQPQQQQPPTQATNDRQSAAAAAAAFAGVPKFTGERGEFSPNYGGK